MSAAGRPRGEDRSAQHKGTSVSDESQMVVPESFMALYIVPGRSRAQFGRAQIAERYEFCEDLAQLLIEEARLKRWELGVTESDVLERIQLGLLAPGAPLRREEAGWVVRRLAELLDWGMPDTSAGRPCDDRS
jgi:hypothetical protein